VLQGECGLLLLCHWSNSFQFAHLQSVFTSSSMYEHTWGIMTLNYFSSLEQCFDETHLQKELRPFAVELSQLVIFYRLLSLKLVGEMNLYLVVPAVNGVKRVKVERMISTSFDCL
jgi:hypothetical protein